MFIACSIIQVTFLQSLYLPKYLHIIIFPLAWFSCIATSFSIVFQVFICPLYSIDLHNILLAYVQVVVGHKINTLNC